MSAHGSGSIDSRWCLEDFNMHLNNVVSHGQSDKNLTGNVIDKNLTVKVMVVLLDVQKNQNDEELQTSRKRYSEWGYDPVMKSIDYIQFALQRTNDESHPNAVKLTQKALASFKNAWSTRSQRRAAFRELNETKNSSASSPSTEPSIGMSTEREKASVETDANQCERLIQEAKALSAQLRRRETELMARQAKLHVGADLRMQLLESQLPQTRTADANLAPQTIGDQTMQSQVSAQQIWEHELTKQLQLAHQKIALHEQTIYRQQQMIARQQQAGAAIESHRNQLQMEIKRLNAVHRDLALKNTQLTKQFEEFKEEVALAHVGQQIAQPQGLHPQQQPL